MKPLKNLKKVTPSTKEKYKIKALRKLNTRKMILKAETDK